MGNGVIGKILYYWIFIVGAIIFVKLFNVFTTDKQMILFLVAVTIIYIVWNVFRALGNRKREAKNAANAARANVVHKGNGKKRHK